MTDLVHLSAIELTARYRDGSLSPVEVAVAVLPKRKYAVTVYIASLSVLSLLLSPT